MENTNYIYARKGKMQTKFTRMVWKNMGENKNGWQEITKAEFDGKAPSGQSSKAPAGLQDEATYRKLYDQGKGFETDEKYTEALAKYEEAYTIKPSSALKGRINKMTAAIEEQSKAGDRNELLELAEAELKVGNFEEAIEAFQSAQEIEETGQVAAKIAEAQKGLEDSITTKLK